MASPACTRVVVFDFDGTLIDSNASKRDAFFELFADQHQQHPIVDEVLREYAEESRYVILEKILARFGKSDDQQRHTKVEELAECYNELAFQAASVCPEMFGASEVLAQLYGRYSLYVSSGTPVDPLRTLVVNRGWTKYFKDVFGYPNTKTESLNIIAKREACGPGAMLVVGDGSSDKSAAVAIGCRFLPAEDHGALARLVKLLG